MQVRFGALSVAGGSQSVVFADKTAVRIEAHLGTLFHLDRLHLAEFIVAEREAVAGRAGVDAEKKTI